MTHDTITLRTELEEALSEIPKIDVHTHLSGGHLGARGLHDILLYHMVISDLYSAGCPSGARLTQFPDAPSDEAAGFRIEEAIPYLPLARNTSNSWALRMLLADLYGWIEPVTLSNWRRLDSMIRERTEDRRWHHELLDRMKIVRTGAEHARRGNGEDDDRLQYTQEWCMPTRCQWGEFDTPLYELERIWGHEPGPPAMIGGGNRPATERQIRTIDDVHAAVRHYISSIPYADIYSVATGISTDLEYTVPSDSQMEAALAIRESAGPAERSIYASYVQEQILSGLEEHAGEIVYQFSCGAEPLPFESGSRISQTTIGQIGEMVSRHPKLRIQCFNASRHVNHALCTLARELPNFSLAGYWWHNFYPSCIRQVLSERLDMVPLNRQVGFFSDAYVVEWTYAKLAIVKKQTAHVLAEKITDGQYTLEDALSIAREILFQTPQSLMGMTPRAGCGA